ncbi:MAG: sodium-independent anion transporter [Lysobacteraceae bacterium]|nr:MAG: sodium-independent anion transporter [Xanthomonadaceae bacterium]
MTVVLTAMVASFTADYPSHGLAIAFTTVMLGGLIQMLFGFLRFGKYIVQVPYPVISGFMTGIGLIIILLQIAPFVGMETTGSAVEAIRTLPNQLSDANRHAVLVGAVALVVVLLWRGRFNRWIPAPIVALLIATGLCVFALPDNTVAVIGDIPSGLPAFQFPKIEITLLTEIITNALMLAVLGSIDSLLTSLVADNLTGTEHDSDRELIGQGIGNTIAGLFGALPGAGATMRTVVNIRAGGTGPLSGVVHALFLLLVVMVAGFMFESIPLAALAAVLVKVGIDIIDWPFLKRIHRLPRFPVFLMFAVLALTVFVDLITAVFIGVFIKNLVTVHKLSELELGSVILTNGRQDTEGLAEEERAQLASSNGNMTLLRITGPVSYAVARGLRRRFAQMEHRAHLLIDIDRADIIGISTAMVIEDLVVAAGNEGTQVHLIDSNRDLRHELRQLDLLDHIGNDHCFDHASEAFAAIALDHTVN